MGLYGPEEESLSLDKKGRRRGLIPLEVGTTMFLSIPTEMFGCKKTLLTDEDKCTNCIHKGMYDGTFLNGQ